MLAGGELQMSAPLGDNPIVATFLGLHTDDGRFGDGTASAVRALQYDLLTAGQHGSDGDAPVALQTFNRDFAPSMMTHRTVVVIISDGWDRGDVSLLERPLQEH